MSRLIDADALKQTIEKWQKQIVKNYGKYDDFVYCLGDVLDIIDSAHTEDEVVRCKDCEYGVDYYHDGECYCSKPCQPLEWFGGSWEYYCADGKRKEKTDDGSNGISKDS